MKKDTKQYSMKAFGKVYKLFLSTWGCNSLFNFEQNIFIMSLWPRDLEPRNDQRRSQLIMKRGKCRNTINVTWLFLNSLTIKTSSVYLTAIFLVFLLHLRVCAPLCTLISLIKETNMKKRTRKPYKIEFSGNFRQCV